MFNRIYKSIFHRIKQTLLLLVVMFVISLLLCVSYSLKNVSKTLKNELSSSIKPVVSIEGYTSTRGNVRTKNGLVEFSEYGKYGETFYEDVLSLKERLNPYYFDLNMKYGNSGTVKEYSEDGLLFRIHDQDEKIKFLTNDYIEDDFADVRLYKLWLDKQTDYFNLVSLVSTTRSQFTDIYYQFNKKYVDRNNKMLTMLTGEVSDLVLDYTKVEEGRTFDEFEIEEGKPKCIISNDLYLLKDGVVTKVEIGDSVKYSICVPNGDGTVEIYKEYEFEVIGMLNYGKNDDTNDTATKSSVIIPEKQLLKIYEDAKDINKKFGLGYNEYLLYYPCIMTLNSFDDIDKFVEYIEELNSYGNKEYTYETSLDSYYSFAGNLETISDNSNILFKFSLVVSILLNIFIINLDLNRRKKEIGLLSSLGQSKKSLMIELILEYVMVLLIALIFAVLISNVVASSFIKTLEFNAEAIDTSNKILDYSSGIKILNNTNININFLDFIKITLIETVIIIITTILSVIQILSIKVREVMIDE